MLFIPLKATLQRELYYRAFWFTCDAGKAGGRGTLSGGERQESLGPLTHPRRRRRQSMEDGKTNKPWLYYRLVVANVKYKMYFNFIGG